MPSGTVKWFNPTKGFGFITPDDGGKDVFVHVTAVEAAGMKSLAEGQRVNFQVQNEPRGLKAVDLTPDEGGGGGGDDGGGDGGGDSGE